MMRRDGMAVVMVLIVLLLIEGMAAGMLALANHTRAAANAQLRSARADAAANFAARSVLRSWTSSRFDTIPVGALVAASRASGTEADATWSAMVERLQSQFVIRAEARVGSPVLYSRSRVIAVARMLDRAAVLNELDAALKSSGSTILAGSTRLAAHDTLCFGIPAQAADALRAFTPPVLSPATSIVGSVVVDTALGRLNQNVIGNVLWSDIAAIADRVVTGIVTPAPILNAAACDTSVAVNWGSPLQSGSACFNYAPLIYSPADLTIAGGTAQGILVVAGVLTMTGNASFNGAVIARDGLSLGPGTAVRGALLVRNGQALIQDADITHSPCELQRVLTANRALHRLLPEHRRFLPVF